MKTKVMIVSSFFVSAVQAATLTPSTGIEVLFINGVKNEEKRELNKGRTIGIVVSNKTNL